MLPDRKGEKLMLKFRKRIKYDKISTGEGHYNSIHNNYVYKVEYPDGTIEELTANIISENMLSQVEYEGHHYKVLAKVIDHKRYDSAITKVNGLIKSSNGNLHSKSTNRVWNILVEWKDGSVDWVPLKDLKQPNPV